MTDAAAQTPSVQPVQTAAPTPPLQAVQPTGPVLPTLPPAPVSVNLMSQTAPQRVPPITLATTPADTVPTSDVSQADRIALFEQVLSEVEATKPATPTMSLPVVTTALAPSAEPSQPQTTPQSVTTPQLDQQPVPPPVEATIVPAGGLSVTEPVSTGVLPQALPMAVHQATDQLLNPTAPGPATTAKERQQTTTPDQQAADATADMGGLQVVEQEPAPELSPEVEAYIQTVQDHTTQAPHEVVIADGSQQNAATTYPSRPVVVVPINAQIEKEGRFKSPVFSIKWLITWSHKIIKMFAGKVMYRETS